MSQYSDDPFFNGPTDLGGGVTVPEGGWSATGSEGSGWRNLNFGSLLGTAGDAYGLYDALGNLRNNQDNVNAQIGSMQDYVQDQGNFSGYGLTSNLGQINYGPDGANYNLNAGQAGQQMFLNQGANQMYNQALQGTDASQQRIFEQMQAQRQPAMNQQYANLQNNVYGAGTGGMRTNNYGGNSQDYAFAKAMNDNASQDMVAARAQAMAEQAQYANIGGKMQEQSYLPMDALAKLGAQGAQGISTEASRDQNNMKLWTELGLGGMTANTNYENIAGKMTGDMWSTASQAANSAFGNVNVGDVVDGAGSLWDLGTDLYDSIFGSNG